MVPEDTWQIFALAILLLLSGFFSASETALMSLSKIRLRHMVEEDAKNAKIISKLLENPSKLLGAILVGNNIVNIGASALATSIFMARYGATGVGIATAIMTVLILIFGEITPKSIAAQNSEQISVKISKVIYFLTVVFGPLISALVFLTNSIARLFGVKINPNQPFITEEELRTIVDVSHEEGVLEGEEKQMIYNVFEFGDSQAKDIMKPRTDMVVVEVNTGLEELTKLFKEEQFSRIPVYEETYDNIIGIMYIKDLIFVGENQKDDFNIRNYMRQPYFTYEFKPTSVLFTDMRDKRVPMAIVLDEYGGTAGLITLEDLVEEIVGDIRDEYDEEENEIQVIKEDEYIIEGSAKIDNVNDMIGTNLESDDFDTIGGYVIGILGRLPEQGECIEHEHIKFYIENIDKNRIEKMRVTTKG